MEQAIRADLKIQGEVFCLHGTVDNIKHSVGVCSARHAYGVNSMQTPVYSFFDDGPLDSETNRLGETL
jgi:hypothetical protein